MSSGGDNKISDLDRLTDPEGRDLLVVVDVPLSESSSKVSKSIDLKTLFGSVKSNTHIEADLSVTGNTTLKSVVLTDSFTPANSTATGIATGRIWSDGNFVYVKLANKIKRISLEDF